MLERDGVAGILKRFDEEHLRLFTFNLDTPHEIVNLRAVALGQALDLPAAELPKGDGYPAAAKIRDHTLWMDGKEQPYAPTLGLFPRPPRGLAQPD